MYSTFEDLIILCMTTITFSWWWITVTVAITEVSSAETSAFSTSIRKISSYFTLFPVKVRIMWNILVSLRLPQNVDQWYFILEVWQLMTRPGFSQWTYPNPPSRSAVRNPSRPPYPLRSGRSSRPPKPPPRSLPLSNYHIIRIFPNTLLLLKYKSVTMLV